MRTKYWIITPLLIILATTRTSSDAKAATPQGAYQVQIVAEDMCCKGCAQKVAGQLYAAPGVTSVVANIENKMVVVTVSRQKGASLEQLWQAVAAGEGGPAKLATAVATFSMTRSEALPGTVLPPKGTTYVVIDNLHCKGCAQKIAAQFYTIRGVSKVNANMKRNTMIIQSMRQDISPWALIVAATNAKERPLAIIGASGRLDIAWSAPKTVNAHQASSPSNNGKVQR